MLSATNVDCRALAYWRLSRAAHDRPVDPEPEPTSADAKAMFGDLCVMERSGLPALQGAARRIFVALSRTPTVSPTGVTPLIAARRSRRRSLIERQFIWWRNMLWPRRKVNRETNERGN